MVASACGADEWAAAEGFFFPATEADGWRATPLAALACEAPARGARVALGALGAADGVVLLSGGAAVLGDCSATGACGTEVCAELDAGADAGVCGAKRRMPPQTTAITATNPITSGTVERRGSG